MIITIDKADLRQNDTKECEVFTEYKINPVYQEKLKKGLFPLLLQSRDYIDHQTSHSFCATE